MGATALLLLVACGGGAPAAETKKQDAPAEAKQAEPEKNKYTLEREAKAQAAKDAVEKKTKMVDELTVLPEKLPKKLDKACDEVAAAQDAFMQKWFPDQASQWASGKGTQLGLTKKTCVSGGSIEVAACQAKALTDAPEELRKEIPALFTACIDKFAKKPAP